MKRKYSIPIAILMTVVFFGTFLFLAQKSRPTADEIQTVSPRATDIYKKIVATGSVQPRKEIEIKPLVPGIINEILVREGQRVATGQIIAIIRLTPNLIHVNEAEARLARAQIALEDAHKTWQRERREYERTLKRGALLTDTESPHLIKLRRALAETKTTELNLADARKTYLREKELFDQQITTASSLQDKKHAMDQCIEAHEKAKDLLRLIREETIEAAETVYQEAEVARKRALEELAAAQRNLQLIREGSTSEKAEQSNTLIRSTIAGMVLEIPVKAGSLVTESNPQNSGTTVATVADMNDMVFKGKIDETEIGKIKTGMELTLTIGAIENETFCAVIEEIAPKGNSVEGTIQFGVEARVKPKPGHFIRAGYSASADIILDRRSQVLAVAEGNLLFDKEKTFAYVSKATGGFEKREVKTGLSDGINIEIVSGLTGADRIKVLH
ncbi:MAG: HlyD family efflux transporter periplasmic adaptor subunit [Desulfobacteraceae bacterium]|jgi:HlyD family secretion protein